VLLEVKKAKIYAFRGRKGENKFRANNWNLGSEVIMAMFSIKYGITVLHSPKG
jgi:hypothetical protein